MESDSIDANNGTAQSTIKQEYKDDISVHEVFVFVLRVMSRTMGSTTLGSEKRQSRFVGRCADSLIVGSCSGVDIRRDSQATKDKDIQAIRDRCHPQGARRGEKGPRYRDEVIGGLLYFFNRNVSMLLSRHHDHPRVSTLVGTGNLRFR